MKRFMFYTGEGITISPDNCVLENYQILGFEYGITYEDAFNKLVSNNPWIFDSGFNTCEILYEEMIS